MTGSSRGFCFVRYFKEESMEDALEYFKDGFEWDDRKVIVEKSTPRPRPGTDSWDPDRRGRGGFGGGDRGRGFGGGRGGGMGGGRARAEDLFSCKVLDMSLRWFFLEFFEKKNFCSKKNPFFEKNSKNPFPLMNHQRRRPRQIRTLRRNRRPLLPPRQRHWRFQRLLLRPLFQKRTPRRRHGRLRQRRRNRRPELLR